MFGRPVFTAGRRKGHREGVVADTEDAVGHRESGVCFGGGIYHVGVEEWQGRFRDVWDQADLIQGNDPKGTSRREREPDDPAPPRLRARKPPEPRRNCRLNSSVLILFSLSEATNA